jgi:hypothetical protein
MSDEECRELTRQSEVIIIINEAIISRAAYMLLQISGV